MNENLLKKIISYSNRYIKPKNVQFQYGTAGFRTKANILETVMFRIGIISCIRSLKKEGKAIGIMITASHNPEDDNGVKLIDPDGEMLSQEWEIYATQLANCENNEELIKVLNELISKEKIEINDSSNIQVITGRDTRPSSILLMKTVHDGINIFHSKLYDMGEVTTPQLHFIVRQVNRGFIGNEKEYYETFSKAYKEALLGIKEFIPNDELVLDGSNGVGAIKAKILREYLGNINWDIRNEKGKLNYKVGADYVKTNQTIPEGIDMEKDKNKKLVSIDGDADRVIYYYIDNQNIFHILDGDKIAVLFTLYIKEKLEILGINLSMGVVQTAYANGASTNYLKNSLNTNVIFTPTGVKYLHQKAIEFDIGIYFEANGHGTVLFNEKKIEELKILNKKWENDDKISSEKKISLKHLLNMPLLINQAIGDALSNILMIEVILKHKNWSLYQWDLLYKDLPNTLRAQKVKDRKIFKTIDAERRLIEPPNLQEKIDHLIQHYENARAFVRPSGTEDVVRIYAEAKTKEQANNLADQISLLISQI
jgi:phosphoacetylglucosamine mutase